jgi:hypothetical protein
MVTNGTSHCLARSGPDRTRWSGLSRVFSIDSAGSSDLYVTRKGKMMMSSPLRSDKVAQDSRRFYSVAEVTRMFGMAQMMLYRAIHDGQFPAVKIRDRYVIPALALDAMEEAAVRTQAVVSGDGSPDGAV